MSSQTAPDLVTANLFYFTPPKDGSKGRTMTYEAPGVPTINYEMVNHSIEIENVRGKENLYTLDGSGFSFAKEPAQHQAFTNDKDIEKEYYPETIEILKRLTGASKVVLFDHTIRRRRVGESGLDPQKRIPVPRVHVDQTAEAAANRVRRHVPEEAEERLKKRFQIINLWRPISNPALDWPLALCDARSVDSKTDLVPVDLIYRDRKGETFGVQYNPQHQWKYLRGMTTEEIVLIKCYDSMEDETIAVMTPHTAFEDPTTPSGAPFRESIELRALVFYD